MRDSYNLQVQLGETFRETKNPTRDQISSAIDCLKAEMNYFMILERVSAGENLFMQCIMLDTNYYHVELGVGSIKDYTVFGIDSDDVEILKQVFWDYAEGIVPDIESWEIMLTSGDGAL